MGTKFFDQYSILHFATGIIFYFFGVDFIIWLSIHILFEILENTKPGMHFINTYLPFWPGGKPRSDTLINSIGDTVFAMLGWLIAWSMDKLGKRYEWYEK